MKWTVAKNIVPEKELEYLRDWCLQIKDRNPADGSSKPNGSGVYWPGLDMASQFEFATEEENSRLYSVYTSTWMYDLISRWLPEPYLFNDQVVVKMPGEHFDFEAHQDGQYGPDVEGLVSYNCTLVLDDFTEENGPIEVLDDELGWTTVLPKAGDVLIMRGDCWHRSTHNKSNKPRRVYICVYTNKPIGEDFQKGFYHKKFYYKPYEVI